jgi:hypothetical protein
LTGWLLGFASFLVIPAGSKAGASYAFAYVALPFPLTCFQWWPEVLEKLGNWGWWLAAAALDPAARSPAVVGRSGLDDARLGFAGAPQRASMEPV